VFTALSGFSFAADSDGDGIDDSIDNCVSVSNADQVDTDLDDIGNACDADDDGDNVIDSQDAFPLDQRYSKDTDGDSLPDRYEQENGLNYQDSSDAELDIDNDISKSFIEQMSVSFKKRKKGGPVRFVYDEDIRNDAPVSPVHSLS
jgi:hypothetical protein